MATPNSSGKSETAGMIRARELMSQERAAQTGFLDLGRLGLTKLPEGLFTLTHLRYLNLGWFYQDFAGNYQSSGNHLEHNSFDELPEKLINLNELTHIWFSHCGMVNLHTIAKLPKLKHFNCSYTQVSTLEPLKNLASLQSLDCRNTQVSTLEPLKNLASLQSLDCAGTQVTDLQPLTNIELIQSILASGCPITELPGGLVFKESLESLFLHRTIIPGIPPEVLSDDDLENCLNRLRAHLKDLEAGSETMRVSKLVVVGNGRVGKTQICRCLQKLEYDDKVPTTHGIVIANFPWPDADKNECLNLWDFGGQDIYHGTHALFLKTRASFLLVWNPDFEGGAGREAGGVSFQNQPLAYWLEYIRTLGREDRPVIIVQSRCDRPELEARRLPVDEAYLKMPFLKICHVSAKKNRGQAALREAITDAIQYLHDKEGVSLIGTGRMKVLRKLEGWRKADQELPRDERQHRTLSLTEFGTLCEDAGGISSQKSLLEYLHNIGTVFYQPELFAGKIILDQTWALEAVYSVFDRDKSCRQIMGLSGHFTRSLLEMAVWSEYSEAEQKLFISLMESCGICFLHRKADARLGLETEYLAPDLLPDKAGVMHQLNGRWDDAAASQSLVYEYPFLHPGLMRSLICDAGKRAGDAGVYWKYGVWVYEKGTGSRALMEQEMTDTQRGRIVARVQGERSGELAQWLRKSIENRSRLFGYPEIKPTLDEFPREETLHTPKPAVEAKPVEAKIQPAETGPKFDRLPVEQFPKRPRANFVSYAWSDATPEGEKRRKLVDDLCSAMEKQGTKVLRDCEVMKTGDRISEFMDRLVEGDHIICVISDKYLRSPNCMHELFHIYRRCGDNGDHFLKKVIPLIMPDAQLKTVSERLAYAGHWKQEQINLEKLIKEYGTDVVGNEAYRKYKNICEFSKNVSDILELLNDRLMPRDFDRMAREGFREVLQLTQ